MWTQMMWWFIILVCHLLVSLAFEFLKFSCSQNDYCCINAQLTADLSFALVFMGIGHQLMRNIQQKCTDFLENVPKNTVTNNHFGGSEYNRTKIIKFYFANMNDVKNSEKFNWNGSDPTYNYPVLQKPVWSSKNQRQGSVAPWRKSWQQGRS